MTESDLEVLVDGELVKNELYRGWQRVRVLRPLEAAAGSLRLEVSDRRPFPIRPGDRLEVRVAGVQVFDGFCDSLDAQVTADRRAVGIGARDRTADLVDSHPDGIPNEFYELGLEDLVRLIAEPLEIEVERGQFAPFDLEQFDVFSLQPSETAWAAIERACRLRGVLAYTQGDGKLLLAPPAAFRSPVALVEGPGGNVLSARLRWDNRERYRTYRVLGQRSGSDFGFGDAVAAIEGRSLDLEIGRPRLLEIVAEGAVSTATATQRAQWEATVRAARAQVLEVVVQGFDRLPGATAGVWRPNELVPVRSFSLGLDTELLCRAVQFARDPESSTVTLELVPRDSYTSRPDVAEREDPKPFQDIFFEGVGD